MFCVSNCVKRPHTHTHFTRPSLKPPTRTLDMSITYTTHTHPQTHPQVRSRGVAFGNQALPLDEAPAAGAGSVIVKFMKN